MLPVFDNKAEGFHVLLTAKKQTRSCPALLERICFPLTVLGTYQYWHDDIILIAELDIIP